MSAVTLAQFTGEDGSVWNTPAKPQPQSEPAECRSSFPHPRAPMGRARCTVDHQEQGTTVHGADVNGHWFPWSTRKAAAAWSAVDMCTYAYCSQIVTAGEPYCSSWCARQDKGVADNRESEAA